MILDTSFILDLMRGDEKALKLLDRLEGGSAPLRVPAPVFYELWEGIERSERPLKEEKAVAATLEGFEPLPLTASSARRAGTLSGGLIRRGATIDDVDALIAAMSLEAGARLVTRNAKHFARVPGLELVTY